MCLYKFYVTNKTHKNRTEVEISQLLNKRKSKFNKSQPVFRFICSYLRELT